MKLNLFSLFGCTSKLTHVPRVDEPESNYDERAEFYYINIINSLRLFSCTSEELAKLAQPLFDPMFELESEIDGAFIPVCFDTVFRNGLIDISFKSELLSFKKMTDDIPPEIWDWDFINNDETWVATRQKANELLVKLGIADRTYDYSNTNINPNL